ncbi:MAG TPA: hypothetical protein PK344_17900, partial [Syntrophorhabdaceae bacterium]|nr:hypothetical protein [Syntrophorhabdaceae bacterium]
MDIKKPQRIQPDILPRQMYLLVSQSVNCPPGLNPLVPCLDEANGQFSIREVRRYAIRHWRRVEVLEW